MVATFMMKVVNFSCRAGHREPTRLLVLDTSRCPRYAVLPQKPLQNSLFGVCVCCRKMKVILFSAMLSLLLLGFVFCLSLLNSEITDLGQHCDLSC